MKNIFKLSKDRHLTPQHIACASFLGELANEGVLNQGNALLAGRTAGKNLAEYVKGLVIENSIKLPSNPKEVAEFLIRLIDMSDDYKVLEEGNKLIVAIRTNMCKYCPKGVGGAEISGTVCPFPGTLEAFLSNLLNKKVEVLLRQGDKDFKKTPLVKIEGYCTIELKIEE